MKELNLRNVIMMRAGGVLPDAGRRSALCPVCCCQHGVSGSTRSFAILEGPYRYDSSAFWNTVPTITFVLFIIALVANWNTPRRKLLVLALSLFMIAGLAAGLYLEPMFDEMKAIGFRDEVDPVLQARAATWYAADWAVWSTGAAAGVALCWRSYARPHPRRRQSENDQRTDIGFW